MRVPSRHDNERQPLEVKMTPMIDVIFLLLIFFVSTSSFQPPEEVLPTNMSLPGNTSETVEIDPLEEDLDEVVVKVMWREGGPRWEVNQREYRQLKQVGGVLTAVAGFQDDLPVILDVEGVVPMENVIDVYDLCRQIGLQRIQFAAAAGS
jgi:biopolymer transport protein ExbD